MELKLWFVSDTEGAQWETPTIVTASITDRTKIPANYFLQFENSSQLVMHDRFQALGKAESQISGLSVCGNLLGRSEPVSN